jgi:hypothetical protein
MQWVPSGSACSEGYTGINVCIHNEDTSAGVTANVQCDGETFVDTSIAERDLSTTLWPYQCRTVKWSVSNNNWIHTAKFTLVLELVFS